MSMTFHVNLGRDLTSAVSGALLGGVGLVGTLAKKLLVAKGDGLGKRILVGAGASLITGGLGLIPYLIATPGRAAEADVMSARQEAADRYE